MNGAENGAEMRPAFGRQLTTSLSKSHTLRLVTKRNNVSEPSERLLILTGCRLGEIMTLRWNYVDLSAKVLRLPDSKTGAKVVHLGQAAIEGCCHGKAPAELIPYAINVR